MDILFARNHYVGGRRTCIHNPHATSRGVFGQADRLRCRARHCDGHERLSVLAIWTRQVVPDRSVLGLYTSPVLFRSINQRRRLAPSGRLPLHLIVPGSITSKLILCIYLRTLRENERTGGSPLLQATETLLLRTRWT